METSKGFTLLEVLVSVAIVAMIGLATNGVLTTVLTSEQTSNERFVQLQNLQRAMILIERDLQQAMERPVRIEGQSNGIVISGGVNAFESDADGLALVRGGWQNPNLILPRSTLQAVGYRLQNNELQRLYSTYVDNVVGSEPKVRILLSEVEDLQIQFLVKADPDQDQDAWEDTFSGTKLPKAISIEITSLEFGVIRREFALAGSS